MPDSDDEAAAILREATAGKSIREIAKARGMLQTEINRILDLEAQRIFSGEGTRREVLLESQRLGYLKQALWERYMREGDNPSAALYIKASERLSSMLGWNHPLGHVITVTGHLPQERVQTSTDRLRAVLDELQESDPHKEERDAFNEMLRQRDAAAAARKQIGRDDQGE